MYADDCDKGNSMDEIEGGLYLGSMQAASDEDLLRREGISHVLSALRNVTGVPIYDGITYKHIKLIDYPNENITKHIPDSLAFISQGLRVGRVLVHCLMGISRSSSIVTSYFMVKYSVDFEEALNFVKEKRPCINPNLGFRNQISSININEYQRFLD